MSRTQGPLIERALSRILRFTFRRFYHGFAWTYDAVARAVSLGRWYSWTEAVLPFVTGLRVLELGHGTGHLLGKLSMGQGRHVVGLDESSQMAVLAPQTRALET